MSDSLPVTKVNIRKVETESSLRAFASIVLGGIFMVKGLKIIEGSKGMFVGFPSEKGKDGAFYDTAFPLSREYREEISEAVMSEFLKAA
ncbi:MAG: septation protein SpoVG family protein [Fibrobacterota bacterium]